MRMMFYPTFYHLTLKASRKEMKCNDMKLTGARKKTEPIGNSCEKFSQFSGSFYYHTYFCSAYQNMFSFIYNGAVKPQMSQDDPYVTYLSLGRLLKSKQCRTLMSRGKREWVYFYEKSLSRYRVICEPSFYSPGSPIKNLFSNLSQFKK